MAMVSLAASGSMTGQSASGSRHYFFISDQRVITVELIDERKSIVNYINLGDSFEIIQAPQLLILDAEGRPYHGHVIEVEDANHPNERYKVTELVQPDRYVGHNILGNYLFQAPPERVFLKIGSRIAELDPVSESDFNLLAAKIGNLDLAMEDGKQMVLLAGFRQGWGTIYGSDAAEVEQIEGHFPNLDEVVPPVFIEGSQPGLPASFAHLPDPVVVELSARVSRSGAILDIEVVHGLAPRLDQLARETVQNTWTFLPAISKGKIADTQMTVNVVFRRGAPERPRR
jgi:hypothetical protein